MSSRTAESSERIPARRWSQVAGAWLGVGTAPGALLLGAGLAQRHGGQAPLLTLLLSLAGMFTLLWFQGSLGLKPPFGDGYNFTRLTPLYFGAGMQRILGGLIALGMIGWFGFNVGLGGAAFSALLQPLPAAAGPLLLGLPVLLLSLFGMRSWNALAALTTIAVMVLVALVTTRLSAPAFPVMLAIGDPLYLVTDIAAFIGYISVFSVRAPDFSAGLSTRRDLIISVLLLCLPVMAISVAGVNLHMGTGSTDLVGILAGSGGLALANLLLTLAVIAPTFTTLYSGAPALKSATGIPEKTGMVLITVIGLGLAIARFDLWLISWLRLLAALLPPLIVPLAAESYRRRRGHHGQLIPLWVWMPGSLLALFLMLIEYPLAPLAGLLLAGLGVWVWYAGSDRMLKKYET